jgi:hypothetical protein
MKDDSSKNCAVVFNIGYHFSRFRRKGWRGLCIEELSPDERAESWRRAKLKGLYWMGVLLMTVGFLICFNAVYRTPGARQTRQALTLAPIEAGEAVLRTDSEFTTLKGQGD